MRNDLRSQVSQQARVVDSSYLNTVGRRIASQLDQATFERIAPLALANAEQNRPRIRRSILELTGTTVGEGDAALVIAAGPSGITPLTLSRP